MGDNTFTKEIKKAIAMRDYTRIGFEQNPFLPEPRNYVNSFVNRSSEQAKIARYLNDLAKQRISNIVILGVSGIGKTHFLNYLCSELKKEKLFEKIGFDDLINISNISQFGENIPNIFDLSPSTKISSFIQATIVNKEPIKKPLIFLDNADQIWLRTPEIIRLFDNLDKMCIVSVWRTNVWRRINRKASFRIPKPVALLLRPLNLNDCISILKNRIKTAAANELGLSLFTNDSLEEIAFLSLGNPHTLITHARGCLDMALEKNIQCIDKKFIAEFTKFYGLQHKEEIRNVIESLTPRQFEIVELMHSYGKGQKFNAPMLAEKFDISRSAMVQHLQKLKDKYDIIDSRVDGKNVMYYLKPFIIRFLDMEYEKFESESDIEEDILMG